MRSPRISSRILVPTAILLIAAVLRLWGLSSPHQLYWDEQYYVFDAEVYLGGGIGQFVGTPPAVKIADEGTWIHPPLGKWIMALLGVGPLGNRPIGWRLPSAVFGIAGVGLLYLLALRLWRSVWWAGFSALMLALDGLHIVQSRIAMLDIFLTTFITAGVLFLAIDREGMERTSTSSRWRRTNTVFGSPFRFWSGVMFGAALATKWSGAYALIPAAAVCAVWLLTDSSRRRRRSRLAAIGTVFASFVIAPLAVYLVSYGSFFYQHGPDVRDFAILQWRMLQYQQHHIRIQPENSVGWTWPLMLHPIQYFRESASGSVQAIVAIGNPALWWGFLLMLPPGLVMLVRRATWRDPLILGGYAAMYLPWLLVPRSQFFFYMLPAVPFMCLWIARTLRSLPVTWGHVLAATFLGATVVCASLFAPMWAGWRVPGEWTHALGWFPTWPL